MSENNNFKKAKVIFRIKPIRKSNKAISKFVGVIGENEKLIDEVVLLDEPLHHDVDLYGKHAIPLKKIDDYDMIGRLYWSNIIDSYIVLGTKYPILYLSIEYNKPLVSGSLCQFILSFNFDKEEKKKIVEQKNNALYKDLEMKGKYSLHFDGDPQFFENYEKLLIEMLRKEAIEKMINEGKNDMEDNELLDYVNEYIDNERKNYDNIFYEKEYDFETIGKAKEYFINLCGNKYMNSILKICMECRRLKRLDDVNANDECFKYEIPKNNIKTKDILEELENNDEFVFSDDE